MRLQTKAANGDKRSEKLLNMVAKPNEFITTILIGNNIANIVLPTLVTTLAIQYGFSVGLASAILTVTIIIFSEVIPKSIAAAFPERVAFLVQPIIRFFIIIFKPVTFILNWMTGTITRALSKGQQNDESISKEELRAMVDIADSEGTFNQVESYRIKGVMDFYNLDVMDRSEERRVDVMACPSTASFEEVRYIR